MSEPAGEREHERLRSTSRYSLYVGLAFLVLVVVATLNSFRTDEGGVLGSGEAEAGMAVPEFAVPELPGGPEGDANIFQDDCATAANPCPAAERRTPACQVEGEGVIRICDLFDRPLVLSFWFSTPEDCPPTQDALEAVQARYRGRVNFLSIAVRGDRDELEETIRGRGWSSPVGWDRDGAVSNLLRVGLCPTVAFVLPGGILSEARIGAEQLTPPRLDEAIESLLAEPRRRAEELR